MSQNHYRLPHEDLNFIFQHTSLLWEEIRGSHLFATGITGFWGQWLLESFLWANDALNLNCTITLLTRNKEAYRKKMGALIEHAQVTILEGDVKTFLFPEGEFSHVIHAATDARASLNDNHPLEMLDTIVDGTRRVLDFASKAGCKKFLLASSGAVYGKQPPEMEMISEDYLGSPSPTDSRSAYAEGKRMAELLSRIYSEHSHFECKIARGFAFSGPGLPLNEHFAIGNFMGDLLAGRQIEIKGDGTPFRSYLDAADLTIWLWTIFFCGQNGRPYNVGSEKSHSIFEIANLVNQLEPNRPPVNLNRIPDPKKLPERYVPSTQRARDELGLKQQISLQSSLEKWKRWLKRNE